MNKVKVKDFAFVSDTNNTFKHIITLLKNQGIGVSKYFGDSTQEWIDKREALDDEFYFNHQESNVAPMFVKMHETYATTSVTEGTVFNDKIAKIIGIKYKTKWDKDWYVLEETVYNPIENYSMEEVRTPNLTTTSKQDSDLTTTEESQIEGFNSPTMVDSGKITRNVSGDGDENKMTTSQTGTEQLERSGNIGVTTSQQMIESELELRSKLFYDMVMKDIASVLCLHIY